MTVLDLIRDRFMQQHRVNRGISLGASASLACASLLLTACTPAAEETVAPAATASSYDEYDSLYQDWAPRYVECVRAAGGAAELMPGQKSIKAPTIPGRPQQEGLDLTCLDEVGPAPLAPPVTDTFLIGMYELYQKEATCLRDAGYHVTDAPSRDVWVETYSGESWFPLLELVDRGIDITTPEQLCPQPSPNDAERIGREIKGK